MLTYLVCLLLVVACVFEPTSESDYILDIDNNMLKNIRIICVPDPMLNLSGRNLQAIEKDVFDNVSHVVSLDLSNNSLTFLPEFIFSNLSKLKKLSLANNQIRQLNNSFVGLENLQLLDISRNPIDSLMRGSLHGLPKSARILTNENKFEVFSADMSRNYLFKNEKLFAETVWTSVMSEEAEIATIGFNEHLVVDTSKPLYNIRLKFCKSDGIVTTLDIVSENEELAEGCVLIDVSRTRIHLHDQNITGFRQDWYRLYSLPIDSLDLSNNRIADIEKETLNNLPENLTYVNFQNNQIRKIRSHMIENDHLRHLNFKNNLIEEIENNAFAKTKLQQLDLDGNQLKSLNFVSTLPDTMTIFIARKNNIISIPEKAFSRLSRLIYLNLQRNKIQKLQNDVFQNLKSLLKLKLSNNFITTIEPAAFEGLTSLVILELHHNHISDLQTNPFIKLTALRKLNLFQNKIVKVPFADLPRTLDVLYLDLNEIGALEKDSFVEVPKSRLILSNNNISSIARGAFNLPTLKELVLGYNKLTTFESDSYEGLGGLINLLLSDNQISDIRKGSRKNLRSLERLDISSNPFQKLEAGAFYGLNTEGELSVFISNNSLKEMQAGLFDDI